VIAPAPWNAYTRAMAISLTPEQHAWIVARIGRGEFASVEDAARQLIDERIAERALDDDDLGWAKPFVDEARATAASGGTIDREEHRRRMAARVAALKG